MYLTNNLVDVHLFAVSMDTKAIWRPLKGVKHSGDSRPQRWKHMTVHPEERNTWISGVRSALPAASQLPGGGPTDVYDASAC